MFLKIFTLFNFWSLVLIPVKIFTNKVNYVYNHLHLVVTLSLFIAKAPIIHESSIIFYTIDFILMNTYKCITNTEKIQYRIHHFLAIFFLLHKYPLVKHIYLITEISNIPLMLNYYVVEYVNNKIVVKSFIYCKFVWYFYFRCIYPIHFIDQGIRTLPIHIMTTYFVFYLIGPYYSYSMVKEMIKI